MLVEIIDGMPVGYMTLKQAAEKWDIAESSARVYISDKKRGVPVLRIDHQIFIKEETPKPGEKRSPSEEDKIIDGKLYMTVKEAAKKWNMFIDDIHRLIKEGAIPFVYNGGRYKNRNKFIMIPINTPKPDLLPGSLENTKYPRILRCMQRNGIEDIESVQYMTREDILDLKGMGPASLRVLEKMMLEKGL